MRTAPHRPSTHPQSSRRRGSHAVATLALAVVATLAVIAGCTPPAAEPPPPPPPPDIAYMDDAQLDAALQELAPRITAGWENPELRDRIPVEQRATIGNWVKLLQTAEGRAQLGAELRAATIETPRGLPAREERPYAVDIGDVAGLAEVAPEDDPLEGERTPPPPDTGGVSVPLGAPSGPCAAPDGMGTVAPPVGGAHGGQLLTPAHNVFAKATTGIALGQPGPIVPTGQEGEPGAGTGITLRPAGLNAQEMLVRIHMSDPKAFGPGALYPILRLRPLDGGAEAEIRATVVGGKIHCYAGDSDARRGYFEGWVRIPRREPGFQLVAEVVDNDWFFSQPGPFGLPLEPVLAAPGPQYFAGADRATVHVGSDAVTSAQTIPRSVGAFASAQPDGGRGGQNVLTETNGEVSDDVEVAVRRFVFSTIRQKVSSALSGDIVQAYVLTVQATPTSDVRSTADVKFVPLPEGRGDPAGVTSALRADVTAGIDVKLFVQLLGIPCTAITASIDTSMSADVWAGSGGNDTSLNLKYRRDVSVDANFDMPWWAWLDPTCALAWLAGPPVAEHFIADSIEDGLDGALGFTFRPECIVGGQPTFDITGPVPDRCLEPGALQKIMLGLDLNDYLPTMSLGGANIRPVVTNLDNAWCRTTNTAPPPGCTPDQNLLGRGGAEITADAAMIASLSDALGAPLGGRFRNVYAPTLRGSVEDVVVQHRDMDGRSAGLGVVVDPRQINLILRHLAQGGSSTRTTNGLLDVAGIQVPIVGEISVRPEVAPIVLGVPEPEPVVVEPGQPPAPPSVPSRRNAPIVLPDLRIEVRTGPVGPPITYSASAKVGAGATFDPATGKLKPVLDTPQVDLQVVDGCQADYTNFYWLSYVLCGRGSGGTGGPSTLTDLINFVANDLVLPAVAKSIGGIGLPNLSGIVPGLDVALTNVRSDQRGGHIGVYADLRPVPRIGMAISPNQSFEPPSLRFFPSNFSNIDVVNNPTTYTWEVRDAVTDQVLPTTPVQGAETSAVRVGLDQFTEVTDYGGTAKKAKAKLTVTQPGLQLTVEGTYTWRPPSPQPPTCGGLPPVGNFKVATGTGETGGVGVALAPPPTIPPGC